eukprot:1152402-Pelagomonas_calceolata.AAC.4
MARGEAELRGVANRQNQRAQQQQQLQKLDKQPSDQNAAKELHEEPKPASLRLQSPPPDSIPQEATNGTKNPHQLGRNGTVTMDDKGKACMICRKFLHSWGLAP